MNPLSNDQIVFTSTDMKRLFVRHFKLLKRVALISGCMVFFCLLLTTPKYILEGTFNKSGGQKESLGKMMQTFQQFMEPPTEASVTAVLQSHAVMRKVIEDLGVQVECQEGAFIFNAFKKMFANLQVEFGSSLPDRERFIFREVDYSGEKPLKMFIQLHKDGLYQLYNQKKQLVDTAKLGEEIVCPLVRLKLQSVPSHAKWDQLYCFTCYPMEKMVKRMRNRLKTFPSKWDKNLLHLTFACRDRQEGAEFLNHLMQSYQSYLRSEHDKICQYQIAYLQKRQEELTGDYHQALLEHTSYLSENLKKDGCMGFAQELETLSVPKNLYTSKLFDVDLQLKRLRDSKKSDLQEQRFASLPRQRSIQGIQKQRELQILAQQEAQLRQRLDACELEQLKHPVSLSSVASNPEEKDKCSGLNLETAQRLLMESTQELDTLQAQMRELAFLSEQLSRADFEMSSLGGVCDDAVTRDVVQKASAIALQLKDENNRSAREQERLVEILQTQKNFLAQHLCQTSELKKLRAKLLEDKASSLQQMTFELLQEEQELLKGKLLELNAKMKELPEKWRRESLLLGRKEFGMMMLEWVSQLIESKALSQNTFQIHSRPLDWATIPQMPKSSKAFLFGLLGALVGSAGCYLALFSRSLLKGLPVSLETLRLLGFPVSGALSKFCHVPLSQMHGEDLETLRHMVNRILCKRPQQQGLLALYLKGRHPDVSFPLAELLALRGLRVIVVQAVFDRTVRPEEMPGLWQYVHEEISEIPLRHKGAFDLLQSGGTSRYALEILSSPKAQSLLEELKRRYDVVLLCARADPTKMEGISLLKCADVALITVQQEKKEDLAIYSSWAQQKGGECATFVYAEE
jgi:hypothetical protein